MADIYGIDLGTTNSCIALMGEDGEPHVLENFDGYPTTPSVVYFDDGGNVLVGDDAKALMGGDPENTVAFIKREIGNPNYKRTIQGENITPLMISAIILKKLVKDANDLREQDGLAPIHKAIITVPAYFGSTECAITRQAGELAGLEVIKLLPEPTAAAISYGMKDLEGKTFMVYDLGGGTFDVSIMRAKNGHFEELSNDGDHHLGGVDWDVALANYAFQQCGIGIDFDEIRGTKEAGSILLAAERTKKLLSQNEFSNFSFRYNRTPYTAKITRAAFNELMESSVDNTIMMMKNAIRHSKVPLTANDIEEIILVGGSSFMPMIREAIKAAFPNATVRLDRMKPNLAVAEGAAIAATLKDDAPTPLSSCSYGVGCEVNGQSMSYHLITRGDKYGTVGEDQFITRDDNSTSVSIKVLADRSYDAEVSAIKCKCLASKALTWGFPVPKGTRIDVKFNLTEDGILKVTGVCSGETINFELDVEGASEDEVEDARRDINSRRIG
ncbi:MAG: Hsp70 family protein [Muribaculaceae bacterium]